ncbi:metal ABC transporter ATP-binding protein [Dactylosporangium sucinum]|uniref:metal ABC transporter ATP-binding protein n=1 Tax=Dactylosporangium sucinum TaxID=1424081 RepID=UPI00167D08C5|nr:metal ABC transporter ATP-binding protein [Dactylosporangium sucinum]
MLEVDRAVVAYDGRPVLDGVSLKVAPAEVVAILGANGSGKSTLVKAALGLVPLSAGEVRLFGTPLRRFREWRRLGYVPQRVGAGSGVPATVAEVVAEGRLARRGFLRVASAADRRAVAEALEAVGLAERAREPVAVLSGGQQQRVLIARALAGGPELLVLDEPTAGVDAASQEAFAGCLDRFVRDGGTVVFVAHELGPLRPLITRAVVVHHGEIVHDGDPPETDNDHVHPHAGAA